jgi:hypothetical protein
MATLGFSTKWPQHMDGGDTDFVAKIWKGLEQDLNKLSKNEGFNLVDDFFRFFNKDFEGKIIHWTNYKYQFIF